MYPYLEEIELLQCLLKIGGDENRVLILGYLDELIEGPQANELVTGCSPLNKK